MFKAISDQSLQDAKNQYMHVPKPWQFSNTSPPIRPHEANDQGMCTMLNLKEFYC